MRASAWLEELSTFLYNSVDSFFEEKGSKDGKRMHIIGMLDKDLYSCITKDISVDEVIITDKQIEHIKERHPGDYERFHAYFADIIANPDYILEANKPNTAFILKELVIENEKVQCILRLKTSSDPDDYKNSVITFLKIDQKKWDKYLRNKTILYKKK